ncbi:MAG: biosynthetic arginine decarboxylase [Planctomycetota bacterium]
MSEWTAEQSSALYGVNQWGKGYFSVSDDGHLCAHPTQQPSASIDMRALVDELTQRGIATPVLVRFPDLLEHRIGHLTDVFAKARADFNYQGEYRCVFPIKVNQSRQIVEEVYAFGKPHGFGLEAGSKPELLAVLSLVEDNDTPIICNGFKDDEFIEAVVLARKIGRKIIPVVEKFSELEALIHSAKRHGVMPDIGLRVKLSSKGAGRWEQSGGVRSKFGLFVSELLDALALLREHDMGDALAMLHVHVGSQIHEINAVRDAITELARTYVELHKLGAKLRYIDIGGGLGVDYDGAASPHVGSINYDLQEYANDVVFGIRQICDDADVPHPHIISESGRAVVAYGATLVFDAIGWSGFDKFDVPRQPNNGQRKDIPTPVRNLFDALAELDTRPFAECWHDALLARSQMEDLYRLGYCSLELRATGEKLFFAVATRVLAEVRKLDHVPDEFADLESMLSTTYFCNLSIFQSMPDSWAIDQVFPILPIHRLDERPTGHGILADITCDSDGKIDQFIRPRGGGSGPKRTLELHPLRPDEPYYLAACMVGAYQEILGDLHNLFGDTNVVHVKLTDTSPAGYEIDEVIEGESCEDVLRYVQYEPKQMVRAMRKTTETALRAGKLSVEESRAFLKFFTDGLEGYTYLE